MSNLLLGQFTPQPEHYSPEILQAIPRKGKRPPFGVDIWNAYEVSWLNNNAQPEVAILQLIVSSKSPKIVESKSLKLYLNSFNFTKMVSQESIRTTIQKDLSTCLDHKVDVFLYSPDEWYQLAPTNLKGICIDQGLVEPNNIDIVVTETLYTHLFRSLCPVTGQPDWATICIDYFGKKIPNHDLLLRITSYRNHPGFHEECIETLFWQLTETYTPQKLSVTGLFTRRGGIDINPQRSTHPIEGDFYRSFRQ